MTEEKKHEEHHGAHHEEHAAHHAGHNPLQGMPEIPKVNLKGVTPAALKGGFMDVVEILKMNKAKMETVAGREAEGINMALVYLAIGSIAAPIGGMIFGYGFGNLTYRTPVVNGLIGAVISIVMAAVFIYVTNLVAVRLFKGKGNFPAFFRVMGYASLINVVSILTIVSLLGAVAGIWLLVVYFFALQVVHKLDATNTVLTIIVSVVVMAIIGYLLALIGLSAFMGGVGAISGLGMPGVSIT